jgi:bacillithiol disulfide reductase
VKNTTKEKNLKRKHTSEVAIIGAGPIGLELAVALQRAGVDYVQFEAGQIGQTISWWPRETRFFSTTERIEIAGVPIQNTSQQRTTGEEYLAYLRAIVEQFDLPVHTFESVVDLETLPAGFRLLTQTSAGEREYTCQKVVFAKGGMDAPNWLNIQGENLPHVSHYFVDVHTYFRRRLLIVGGKNSALETALRCWRAGAQVTISYRRREFDPQVVKEHLLQDVLTQIKLGNIAFLPETRPVEITPESVILECADGKRMLHPTDSVILHTGFRTDSSLFKKIGVELHGEQEIPHFDPNTMETNIPGIYVAGTVAAGSQSHYRLFIENCHSHVGKIVHAITGKYPDRLGTIHERQYELAFKDYQAN